MKNKILILSLFLSSTSYADLALKNEMPEAYSTKKCSGEIKDNKWFNENLFRQKMKIGDSTSWSEPTSDLSVFPEHSTGFEKSKLPDVELSASGVIHFQKNIGEDEDEGEQKIAKVDCKNNVAVLTQTEVSSDGANEFFIDLLTGWIFNSPNVDYQYSPDGRWLSFSTTPVDADGESEDNEVNYDFYFCGKRSAGKSCAKAGTFNKKVSDPQYIASNKYEWKDATHLQITYTVQSDEKPKKIVKILTCSLSEEKFESCKENGAEKEKPVTPEKVSK